MARLAKLLIRKAARKDFTIEELTRLRNFAFGESLSSFSVAKPNAAKIMVRTYW